MTDDSTLENSDARAIRVNIISTIVAFVMVSLSGAFVSLYVSHDKMELNFQNHLSGDSALWRAVDNRITDLNSEISNLQNNQREMSKLQNELEKEILHLKYQINKNANVPNSAYGVDGLELILGNTPCPKETNGKKDSQTPPCVPTPTTTEVKNEPNLFKNLSTQKPIPIQTAQ